MTAFGVKHITNIISGPLREHYKIIIIIIKQMQFMSSLGVVI